MKKNIFAFLIMSLLWVGTAHAQLESAGIMTDILQRYQSSASGWAGYITERATWLYWTLVVISMVWTGGTLILKGAGIQDFFSEYVRFVIFVGFFWWLLFMAPQFVPGIYRSFATIGATASGLGAAISPSGIVDIGFLIFEKVLDNSDLFSPIDTVIGIVLSMIILIVLSLVAVNLLLLLVTGWVLGYAGIIYLGFGGSRWTSEMAISYYKTVLALAIQSMTMILIVGIGKTFIDDYYQRMSVSGVEFNEMAVMVVASLVLLNLVNKVPQLVSSIASTNVGMSGVGSHGAAAAIATAGAAVAAAGVAMSAMGGAVTSAAGASRAIQAASGGGGDSGGGDSGSASSSGGSDFGGGGGGGGSSADTKTASSTPHAQASGISEGGSKGFASSLASGMKSMAAEAWDKRVSETTGGKLAAKIEEARSAANSGGSTAKPSFGGDSISGSPDQEKS